MSIETLDHVNIRTPDLESTKAFFVDVLGLEVGARPNFDQPGYWLYAAGGPVVHLSIGRADVRPGTGAFSHVAFRATGLDAMRKKLAARGISYEEQVVPGDGNVQLFLREPNGVAVELQYAAREAE